MAIHQLTHNFDSFFKRLNPSPSFQQRAASEHKTITGLLEDSYGLARELSPRCFLQGSYRQDTAIHSINDVDIVAYCALWQPGSGSIGTRTWNRDEIFRTIAAPLLNDARYKDKVRYHSRSMCVKVDLGIKVEILPVVYIAGNNDFEKEPFRLYRPQRGVWEDGYARHHQAWLTWKNLHAKTNGNFKPAIKLFKHLRSMYFPTSVSFHLECFLFSLPDRLFLGGPADYVPAIFKYIAATPASTWYSGVMKTPCGERDIFTDAEWNKELWEQFYRYISDLGIRAATGASQSTNRELAIEFWRALLSNDYFPKQVP